MLNLKFWPTYPLFAKRNFFRTWQPCRRIWHSCLSEVLKMLSIDFSSQKTCTTKFLGHFDCVSSRFKVILWFFRKKFNSHYLRFGSWLFPFQGKSMSSYSFHNIDMRFAAFYSQPNCLQTVGNRFMN